MDSMYLLTSINGYPIALFQKQEEADMASLLVKHSKVKEMRVRGSYLDYGTQSDSPTKHGTPSFLR